MAILKTDLVGSISGVTRSDQARLLAAEAFIDNMLSKRFSNTAYGLDIEISDIEQAIQHELQIYFINLIVSRYESAGWSVKYQNDRAYAYLTFH